jgi:hypothetical protein
MSWSARNPSSVDEKGATIDRNTIITYLKENSQVKFTQKMLIILRIMVVSMFLPFLTFINSNWRTKKHLFI